MITIPLKNKSNFYSERLTGDILRLYNASVENLARGEFTATVSFSSNVGNDLNGVLDPILEAIFYGCPELFYVEQHAEIAYSGNDVTLIFANKYKGEEVNGMWSKLEVEINRIVEKVKAIPDDYEKLHRINKYLCARVKAKQSHEGRFGDAYGALILKEARCEGFAKAAQLILERAGFKSIIVCGQVLNGSRREDHAWNMVSYKNKYYHFDFTWNASRGQYGIPGQEYMYLDDETAWIEHFPAHADYPKCPDSSKTFWAKHKGIINYHSDLSRIDIVPFKNNYLAMAKLKEMPTALERESDVFAWMRDELSAYNYGSQISYVCNDRLKLLIFYIINE